MDMSTEFAPLRKVLLFRPTPDIENADPQSACHLSPINHAKITDEIDNLAEWYQKHGIAVICIDPSNLGTSQEYLYNMMYCRDLFVRTPDAVLLARMYHSVREDETRYAERTLRETGMKIKKLQQGPLEGADCLWLRPDRLLIGTNKRTSMVAFEEVRREMRKHGITTMHVNINPYLCTQHLLGIMQIVDSKKVFVRYEHAQEELLDILLDAGYHVIKVNNDEEIAERQAFNIVCIAPSRIIMASGCPKTKAMFENNGIEVVGELCIDELRKGAGGLACATGIMERDRA